MRLRSGLTKFHTPDTNVLFCQADGVYVLIQGENSNPFEALLNKDPASFGNWDQGWMNEASVDEESRPLQNGQEESANVRAIFISSTFLSW